MNDRDLQVLEQYPFTVRGSFRVRGAFLLDTSEGRRLIREYSGSVQKLETEQKLLLQPHSFMTRCFTLPDLFAGKMHALVYRTWKNRVKGRDWYDFEWYVRHNIPLGFTHLAERALQFNNEVIERDAFITQLKDRLASANMNQVKSDVLPFVKNTKELDIWSNDYFVQLADMMKFE